MPTGLPYTYVGNSDPRNNTSSIITSQGTVQLGGWGYFLPAEYNACVGEGLLLVPGSSGTTPGPTRGSTAYSGTDGTVGGPGGTPLSPLVATASGPGAALQAQGQPVTASQVAANPYRRTLTCWGHSFMEWIGATDQSFGMGAVAARLVNANEDNRAIAGSALEWSTGQTDLHSRTVWALAVPSTAPIHGPQVDAAFIFTGINDLSTSNYATCATAFPLILRNIFLRLRAAAALTVTDASWSVPNHTPATGLLYVYGGTVYGVPNNNAQTWTAPSWWPAGGVATMHGAAVSGSGGVHTITKNGSALTSFDTRGTRQLANDEWAGVIGPVNPGDVISDTVSSVASSEYFGYMQLAAANPPPIVYANVPRASAYPSGSGALTDAEIATVNAGMATVATWFATNFGDTMVQMLDADTVLGKNSIYFANNSNNADNIHPNNLGHAAVGAAAAAVLTPMIQAQATPGQTTGWGGNVLTQPQLIENTDSMFKPRSVAIPLVGGTVTWTSRAITAKTRIWSCEPIGDPTGGTAGTVGVVSITPSAITTAGTVVLKSTNASDTRTVHLSIYEAA